MYSCAAFSVSVSTICVYISYCPLTLMRISQVSVLGLYCGAEYSSIISFPFGYRSSPFVRVSKNYLPASLSDTSSSVLECKYITFYQICQNVLPELLCQTNRFLLFSFYILLFLAVGCAYLLFPIKQPKSSHFCYAPCAKAR